MLGKAGEILNYQSDRETGQSKIYQQKKISQVLFYVPIQVVAVWRVSIDH
jgi:hypothetical protein